MLFFDNQAKLEEASLEPNGQPVQVKGGVTIGDGLARNYVIYTQEGFRNASGLPSWTPDGSVLTLANGALAIPYEMVQGAPVTSVAGRSGDVVLVKADITDFNEGDYATSAQGSKADSALQPSDAASFATAAQGAKADSALQPTDTIDADTLEGFTKAQIVSEASAGGFDPTSDQNITGNWDFGAAITKASSPVLAEDDIYGESNQLKIGTSAGQDTQGLSALAFGPYSGRYRQGNYAISVGANSGNTDQGDYAIGLGNASGETLQSANAVAIGRSAGNSGQGINGVAIGRQAGQTNQGISAVALGYESGFSLQGARAIAIGNQAGRTDQSANAIAMGNQAGNQNQGVGATALGTISGYSDQGEYSTAVGYQAGQTSQGTNAVAFGYLAGQATQGEHAVAIGRSAGKTNQGVSSISMGYGAGSLNQGNSAVCLGLFAGYTGQGIEAVALGKEAGETNQGNYSVAVGPKAGEATQGARAFAGGYLAGNNNQGDYSIAMGGSAGYQDQGNYAIAMGSIAGQTTQGAYSVAIGRQAGSSLQSTSAVAVGHGAGQGSQGDYSIAMGRLAGSSGQGSQAVAIGQGAGKVDQTAFSIAIGDSSGETNQGGNSVAIGRAAGRTDQGANGIIINATGASYNDTTPNHIHIKTPSGGIDFDGTTMDVVASGGLTVNGAPVSGGGGTVISSNTTVNVSSWASFIDLYSLYRSVTYDNGAVVTIRLTADLTMTSSFELGGACDNIVVDMQGFDIATGNYELTKHLGGTAKIKGHGDITTNNNYKAIVVSNGSIVFTGTGTQTASYVPAMNELDVTIGTTLRLRTASGQTWGTKPLLDIHGNGRVYAKDLTFGVAGVLSSGGGQAINCEGNGSFSGKFIRQYESALSWNRAADGGRIIIVGGVQQNTATYMNSHNNVSVGNGSIVSLSNYDGTHFGTTHATAQGAYKEKQWFYDNATSTDNSHLAYYGSGYDSEILWGGEYAKILPNPKSSELEFTSHAALCSAIGVSNFTPTNGVAPSAAFQDAFRAYILNNAYNPALAWGMRTGDPDNEMKILLGSGNGHYRATGAYYKNPNIFAVEWKWYSVDAEKGRNDWGEQSTFASEDGGHVALSYSHIGEVGTIFSGGNIGMRTDESTCTAHSVGIYETNARAFYFAGGHVDVGRSEVINTTTGWVKQATYTNQCTGKMWVNITATTGDANQGSTLFIDESNMTVKATVTYGGTTAEGCIWFRDSNVVGSITCKSAYDIALKMESSTYNGGMSIVDAGGSRYSISKSTFNGDITVSGTGSAGTFTNSTHNGSVI